MTAGEDFRMQTVVIPEDAAGERLDKALAGEFTELSRSRIQRLIADGLVENDDGVVFTDKDHNVAAGDVFLLTIPAAKPALPKPEHIPLDIVFEDDFLIVLNKPMDMVVHPAPGNPSGTLVNALLHHCGESLQGVGGVARPGIVHRLDKDTSGLMVVAKTDQAHRGLAEQFAAHTVKRAYRALVWGVPAPRSGEIEGNIGRDPKNRKKMAVVSSGGKHALTRYSVIEVVGTRSSLVECRLATGRTHQIRVHMAHIGHPVIGDPLYGRFTAARAAGLDEDTKRHIRALKCQALQSAFMEFTHPVSGDILRFGIINSNYIKELISLLRNF